MAAVPQDLVPLVRQADAAAAMLKLLANAERLMLLCRIAEAEVSVGELVDGSDLSQSSVSQHLARLREANVVDTRRDGQTIYYRLCDPAARRLMDAVCEIYKPK